MTLAEKLRYLREVEGSLRGLGRPMTQQELVRAIRKEQGKSISQSYVSQIEGGVRPHMTQSTRTLLAKFFKVHPGFLVDDPEGYHTELVSDLRTTEGKLDVWLLQGSERFASDPAGKRSSDQGGARERHATMFSAAGSDSRYPRAGGRLLEALQPERGGHRSTQPRKGGDAYDLGRFLSHLFRGGIFLQPAVVSCRRSALASASAPFFCMCTWRASCSRRATARLRLGTPPADPADAGEGGMAIATPATFRRSTSLPRRRSWPGLAGPGIC